jgi:hypothetical protein
LEEGVRGDSKTPFIGASLAPCKKNSAPTHNRQITTPAQVHHPTNTTSNTDAITAPTVLQHQQNKPGAPKIHPKQNQATNSAQIFLKHHSPPTQSANHIQTNS